MNHLCETLKEYVKKANFNYGFEDINSLLELLWSSYTQYNPIYNDSMKEKVEHIHALTDGMPKKDSEKLFDLIFELYEENEREAFQDGLRVGVKLALELNGES